MQDKTLLYTYLGIDKEHFETIIKPFLNELSIKKYKVDFALITIDNNKKLSALDKIYCAYCIGLVVGENPIWR